MTPQQSGTTIPTAAPGVGACSRARAVGVDGQRVRGLGAAQQESTRGRRAGMGGRGGVSLLYLLLLKQCVGQPRPCLGALCCAVRLSRRQPVSGTHWEAPRLRGPGGV